MELPPDEAKHVHNVLRGGNGDYLEVVDGVGKAPCCQVAWWERGCRHRGVGGARWCRRRDLTLSGGAEGWKDGPLSRRLRR